MRHQLKDRVETDEMMLRVQGGDSKAFEALYCCMSPIIRGFLCGEDGGAHPLTMLYKKYFVAFGSSEAASVIGSASAKSYLLRISLNVAREDRRYAERASSLSAEAASRLVATSKVKNVLELTDTDVAQLLSAAQFGLSAKQLMAIKLVYYEELAPQQAAKLLGCTEKAIRRRVEVGRSKLYEFFVAMDQRLADGCPSVPKSHMSAL